jgi:hypothetical protein
VRECTLFGHLDCEQLKFGFNVVTYGSSLTLELHLSFHVTTENIEPVIIEDAGSALPPRDYLVGKLGPAALQHLGFVLYLLRYLKAISLLSGDSRLISIAPD